MNLGKKFKLHKLINDDNAYIIARNSKEIIYICERFALRNNFKINNKEYDLLNLITLENDTEYYWYIRFYFDEIHIMFQPYPCSSKDKTYSISSIEYDYEILKYFNVKGSYFNARQFIPLYLSGILVMFITSVAEYIGGAGFCSIVPMITGVIITGELYYLFLRKKKKCNN